MRDDIFDELAVIWAQFTKHRPLITAEPLTDGERDLLELARILDAAPRYDQRTWAFRRAEKFWATPACALSHWAYANLDAWCILPESYMPLYRRTGQAGIFGAMDAFGLNYFEAARIFRDNGCGRACNDAPRAAAYIRAFVGRRLECRS